MNIHLLESALMLLIEGKWTNLHNSNHKLTIVDMKDGKRLDLEA